ncbi:MAG: WD40 repeat domain-containing protein [Epsilonproteobacteria bacterium]|nr:WD40 repeat domain-containing protein [Campylobacterota bacterium]
MRLLTFCFLTLWSTLMAATAVKPAYSIDVDGNVVEFVRESNTLYIATDVGKLEIYDWQARQKKEEIIYPDIHDFLGDPMKPKIFGVDIAPDHQTLVIMVQDENGERILYLRTADGKQTRFLDKNDHIQMREARFIDTNHLLVATMSNEMLYFSINPKKILWRKQLSLSTFSDFQLNEDRTKVASTCESGIVYVVDVKSGKILKTLEGGNKDNVFKVDFKNYKVLACGQDRKAVLYSLGYDTPIIYPTQFLVYAGALNAQATLSAFQYNENNEIAIFDNATKSEKYRLIGQHSVLNTILFVDDKTLISSSDDNHILIWRLP